MAFQICGFSEDRKKVLGVELPQSSFLCKFGPNCGAVPLLSFLMLSSILLRSFSTLVVGFNFLSVNFRYVLESFNKTASFSLYSSLSITTMDLPLSAERIFTVSSFLRFCSAFSCSFVILTVAGTLQFTRMFATETRIVSFANWLRLKMPFSTEDKKDKILALRLNSV